MCTQPVHAEYGADSGGERHDQESGRVALFTDPNVRGGLLFDNLNCVVAQPHADRCGVSSESGELLKVIDKLRGHIASGHPRVYQKAGQSPCQHFAQDKVSTVLILTGHSRSQNHFSICAVLVAACA